jgi:hypothetical protein
MTDLKKTMLSFALPPGLKVGATEGTAEFEALLPLGWAAGDPLHRPRGRNPHRHSALHEGASGTARSPGLRGAVRRR